MFAPLQHASRSLKRASPTAKLYFVEREADVVIIGAGISGCATAYNLARRGLKVVVLEKDDIAFEASGRSMAAVGVLGKHHPDEYRLAQAAVEVWPTLGDELNTDIEYIPGGRLAIAETRKDLPLFQEMIETAEESGVKIEWLEPRQARKRYPYLEGPLTMAAFSPQEGHVNPPKTVHAFARAAQEYGAKFHTGCLVKEVGVAGGSVRHVGTSMGEIKTGAVINVAGVWANRLLDDLGVHVPIKIIRLPQGETEPLPRLFDFFMRGPTYSARQTASGTLRISGGYRQLEVIHDLSLDDLRDLKVWLPRLAQQRSNVSLRLDMNVLKREFLGLVNSKVMGRERDVAPVGVEPRKAPGNLRKKLRRLSSLIPQLEGLKVRRHWTGYVDLTPDLLPVIGPVDQVKGLYVAMGFSGHGFVLGPVTGRIMADLVTGQASPFPIHAFRPGRFVEEKVKMPKRLM